MMQEMLGLLEKYPGTSLTFSKAEGWEDTLTITAKREVWQCRAYITKFEWEQSRDHALYIIEKLLRAVCGYKD